MTKKHSNCILELTPMTEEREQPFVEDQARCEVVFGYHERTKHHFQRSAASLGYMDWAS